MPGDGKWMNGTLGEARRYDFFSPTSRRRIPEFANRSLSDGARDRPFFFVEVRGQTPGPSPAES